MVSALPSLPYAEWEPTKTTLHLYCQIVGKVRLRCTHHRNHWWNVTLLPTARGLTTGRMHHDGSFFQIDFDFISQEVVIRSNGGREAAVIPLVDGLSVAAFYDALFAKLRDLNIDVAILAKPYGVPMQTPFAEDREHHSYDGVMARRWWEIVLWTADVFDRFASGFAGKQSVPQLFWHSFDLALARYSGRRAPGPPKTDAVEEEAYSHEVIAAGFWPGDPNVQAPTYYTYTAPEPATLTGMTLAPSAAGWHPSGSGHIGTLPYDVVRAAADPAATLFAFLDSGYIAGTTTANWDRDALASRYPGHTG